jgi:hypothetical protein
MDWFARRSNQQGEQGGRAACREKAGLPMAQLQHATSPSSWTLAIPKDVPPRSSKLLAARGSLSETSHLTPHTSTTSQLDRSDFQSIMGSYEGAFSAEPAAGDHPRGGWGGQGSRWLGPRPTRSCQTWLCSGK